MKLPTYPRCSIQGRARWLGEMPDHWQVKRLKFIFPRLFSGVSVNSDNSPSLDGSTAILKTSCVYGNHFNPGENKRVIETEIDRVACPVTRDSLVISRMNTPELVGNCGYIDRDYENLFLPDRLWIAHFQNHPEANGKFAWYLVISHALASLTGVLATGTSDSMKNLTQEAFLDIWVGVPTIPEQQRIAAFLDWKTGQIDALIARKQELLEKLKEKRLAVITQAVTRGLNPSAPIRDSGIPWLGQVPQHWEVIPLGFLMTMSGGLTPSMANAEFWEGEIPWVTPKDMKRPRISDSIDRVTEKALEETAISLIPVNAVLIVVRGMILAHSFPTAVNDTPVTINQDMKALRAGEKLEVEYLFWTLTGFAKVFSALAQESAHGTRKIETETIKRFAFPVPPRDEQMALVRHLKEKLQQLDSLSLATDRTLERLTEYRTALITAATTGKIDVRNVIIPDPVA